LIPDATGKRAADQRFVIDRPRLTNALRAADARITLLIAPAGYGKTTLVRQWLSGVNEQPCWFRATESATDVAALAIGLAKIAERAAKGVEATVIRHLRSTDQPADHADALGTVFAEALSDWPADACLVIDDYDFIAESEPARRFVRAVLEDSPVRAAVAARRRPHWASARHVLYGEIHEVSQKELAFTEAETASLLGSSDDDIAAIWSMTKGWPAVIRLAALTGHPTVPPKALPPALHQYFAEELYQTAPNDVRLGLVRLATLPTLSAELVELALGEHADQVCREATELGFLGSASDSQLELHPLLRTFLDTKLLEGDRDFLSETITAATDGGRWDDAFSMIERFSELALLPRLVEAALDPLLDECRVATLERWIAFANARGGDFPLLRLAEAEVSRRVGRFGFGEARALQAAEALSRDSHRWTSRAYALAGECAQHEYRPLDASKNHGMAESHAHTLADTRRAVWGQFLAVLYNEDLDAGDLLNRFEALADARPATTLRVACGRLMIATLEGDFASVLRDQERYLPLVELSDDPLVTTSFLYRLAYSHIATGDYARGLSIAERGAREARQAHLRFAAGHLTAAMAAAAIGLRHLRRAQLLVDQLFDLASNIADPFELANAQALQARIFLAQDLPHEASDSLIRWSSAPTAAMRGECAALRALALAVLGDLHEARRLASLVLDTTREFQPVTLARMAQAISSLSTQDDYLTTRIAAAEDVLLSRHNYSDFVCAYRAFPPLLAIIRERGRIPQTRLENLIRSAQDFKIASALNWDVVPARRRDQLLSRREREVYSLLCEGLTNREIAQELVIAEVTVKVHVRHILEKLGARTRTEAALQLFQPS
jgi:LuxR family maltose regulon positive regulatory protein